MTSVRFALVFTLSIIAGVATHAVPATPANLQSVVNGHTVSFTWQPSPGATGYVIEAGSAPGLSNLASITVPATPSYSVPGVPVGVYYVRVRSIDASGASAPSNEVVVAVSGASTGPCAGPPDPPTRLRGLVDGTQVSLSWQPAITGCPPTSYIILAGSSQGLANLAQIPVASASFSGNAPDGVYFVSVAGVNAAGTSAPSGSVVVVVTAASPGGVLGFNTATPAIVADDLGNAVVVGEVVNRSLTPAVFIEVTATLRTAQGQTIPGGSTFLRGRSRRLVASGTIDDSALPPGEIGCFYLPTGVPMDAVVDAGLNLTFETFANTPLRSKVDVVDFERVLSGGAATLTVSLANNSAETAFYTLANLYLKRADGRAIGCDYAFVPTGNGALPPGQVSTFTAATHAPDSASTAVGWPHWQEAGDPLGALAAQTYELMRAAVENTAAKRHALSTWQALQQQRRALARQAGQ
jgi:hypothetical protein